MRGSDPAEENSTKLARLQGLPRPIDGLSPPTLLYWQCF
jgi:hypothetical protein